MLTSMLYDSFPKLEGRLLIAVCSYRGGINNPAPMSVARDFPWLGRFGNLVDRLTMLNLRQFIAGNRDFFANPRSLSYQAGMVKELLYLTASCDVTIALDKAFEADPARALLEEFGNVVVRNAHDLARGQKDADATLVIYPDALGLGWGTLENQLVGNNIFLLNGRRRILQFNSKAKRILRWRRFLAVTRLPELAASLAVVPLAAVLATWDAMRGKS